MERTAITGRLQNRTHLAVEASDVVRDRGEDGSSTLILSGKSVSLTMPTKKEGTNVTVSSAVNEQREESAHESQLNHQF